MKSQLRFIDHASKQRSDCGDVLDIELSSQTLDWQGVVLEKGTSPHFYPTNVCTPYFYFALGLEEELHWAAETGEGMSQLITVPGDIWINPPETPFTHEIDVPCYFVILAVEKVVFFQHCPLPIDEGEISFLKNYNVHDDTLRGIIELFQMEVERGGSNGQAYLHSLIAMLSVHYLNNYSSYNSTKQDRRPASRLTQQDLNTIDELIDAKIDQAISVDDMAAALHCSKFYFLREFKKLTGETPYQHLLNRRLDKAKHILGKGKGKANLLALALDLGFSDQPHFTRAFRKRFGVTPSKYKAP